MDFLCFISCLDQQQADRDEMETVNQDISPTQIQFTDEEKSVFMKPKNLIFTPLDKLGRCSSKTLQHSVMIISSTQCHNYYRPFSRNVSPVAIHYSSRLKNISACSWGHARRERNMIMCDQQLSHTFIMQNLWQHLSHWMLRKRLPQKSDVGPKFDFCHHH